MRNLKRNSVILALGLIASLGLASCKPPEVIDKTYPQRLELNSSQVNKTYSVNEALDLTGLVVTLQTYKDYNWEDTTLSADQYTTSIANGTVLTTAGTSTISVSYKDVTPQSFTILVISTEGYEEVTDVSAVDLSKKGRTTYDDGTKDLNMNTLALNTDTPNLDPMEKENHIMIVPYYFSEESSVLTDGSHDRIQKTFFATAEEAKANGQPYSVKSYYDTSSYGKSVFSGSVLPWIPSKLGLSGASLSDNTAASYKALESAGGGHAAATDIRSTYIREYAKENHGILGADAHPFSYFDVNSDGIIDLLWIVYSHPMGDVNSVWWAWVTHGATSASPDRTNPVVRTMGWAPLSTLGGGYDPHTFIHETGHTYGLADYYCYNSSWSPMGGIDMMDHNLGDHNAYSKFSLGWSNPLVVEKNSIVTLKPFTTTGEAILLPSPDYNGTAFDEYLMLQLDSPIGLNETDYKNGYESTKGYSRAGIRLMHVDSRVYKTSKRVPLTTNPEDGYDLAVDNSQFGRNSNNSASMCTTDYWEAKNNDSGKDRSYDLLNVVPNTYDKDNNNLTGNVSTNNDSLFHAGDLFTMKNGGWKEFFPSYTNLWNKARSYKSAGSALGTGVVDKTKTINYEFRVLSLSESEAKIQITVNE